MARINVEPGLFTRGEWLQLVVKTGSPDTALGALVRCWMVAQKYWVPDQLPIPENVWKKEALNEAVIDAGLAERRANGVYVAGSADQFDWLIRLRRASAAGGEANAARFPSSNKTDNEEATRELDGSHMGATTEPSLLFTPLSLLPSQDSFSSQEPPKRKKRVRPEVSPETAQLRKDIWLAYEEAYQARYKVPPARNATVNSQIASFANRLGKEAPQVVRFYLTHNDGFYLKKTHAFGLCLSDAETLRTQWARGRAVTGTMVRSAEKTIAHQELLRDIQENGI